MKRDPWREPLRARTFATYQVLTFNYFREIVILDSDWLIPAILSKIKTKKGQGRTLLPLYIFVFNQQYSAIYQVLIILYQVLD